MHNGRVFRLTGPAKLGEFLRNQTLPCQSRVRLLLSSGADAGQGDAWGHTPLHYAAQKNHREIVRLLLAAGAPADVKNRFGNTPLIEAAHGGHDDIVELLVEAGANPDVRYREGKTLLHQAACKDYVGLAERLLATGLDVEILGTTREAPTLSRGTKRETHHCIARAVTGNCAPLKCFWQPVPTPRRPRDTVGDRYMRR